MRHNSNQSYANPLNPNQNLSLLALVAILVALGLLAALIADWLSTAKANHLLTSLVQTLSDALIVTGALGLAVDFFTGRDREAKDDDRIRRLLKEQCHVA